MELENAGRTIPVERHLRVGIVIHQEDVEFPAPPHHFLEIIPRRYGRCRIVRIIQIQDARAAKHIRWYFIEVHEKIVLGPQRIAIRLTKCELRSADVREISRLRNYRDVSILRVCKGDVRYPFLRPDERYDFSKRIELEIEPALHESRDRFTILDETETESIPAHRRVPRSRS